MTRPGSLQAFAQQAGKAFVQAVKRIDRRGVVIGSGTLPSQYPSIRPRSRNQLWIGVLRAFTAETARSEKVIGARPGGADRHFCVPA